MESQHQKWVYICYLAISALVGYVVFSLAATLTSAYDLEARVRNIDIFLNVGPIAIAALLFLLLYRNDKANQFMNEVVVELSRVTWPTQKETSSATFIVIIMVLISGMVLGFLDYFWTKVLQWIL